jgi:hypothetical protein
MEKEKIILIILVLAIVAFFFYLKPQQPLSLTTTTTTLPMFSEEIKKQSLQKINLTYSLSNGSDFSIAQFLDFSQFTIGNESYIKNSTTVVYCTNACNVTSEATTPFDKFLINFQNSTFEGVRSTKFGLCKLFVSTKKGNTCILENGFPYNYSFNGLNFTLKKIQNFSNPIGFVVLHFYSYYNESSNKTIGRIEIFPFHNVKNGDYKILASQTIEGKINISKAQAKIIDFTVSGYSTKVEVIINNMSYSATPEFYYSSGCPKYCLFGCIPGTSTCYYPEKIQLKNGNFSQGFNNWKREGTGFMLCNLTSCQAPFGGAWSGYSAINFATTCAGKTTSFGNLTSDFFVAYLPFLSFQAVSYPSAGMYFLIVARNGSILKKYEIDTTPISKNVTTFANVSIPIAQYISKEIAIKVVQTQSGFIDYVKCLAVGNFYQTSQPTTTNGAIVQQVR